MSYLSTATTTLTDSVEMGYYCFPNCDLYHVYYFTYTIVGYLESTFTVQNTATIPYSQTVTSSITQSSTSLVPASAALGLTDGSFTALAVVVIGILALLTAYLTLKPRVTHRPRQAKLSQFAKAPSSCIKCGAKLPPASEFCNKCGTKQLG
jgi:ribosomal protein L40E